jgi:hypothetical protein
MSLHVFDRMLLRISSTNVIFCDPRLTEIDYYLPLKISYSQLFPVLCLLFLTLSDLVMKSDSQNFTVSRL